MLELGDIIRHIASADLHLYYRDMLEKVLLFIPDFFISNSSRLI